MQELPEYGIIKSINAKGKNLGGLSVENVEFLYKVDYFFVDLFGNRGYNNAVIKTDEPIKDEIGFRTIAAAIAEQALYAKISLSSIQQVRRKAV